MANDITDTITAKVADLIKIKIPKSELAKYTRQLNTALDSITVLKELDTDEVAITSQTHGLKNILRKDKAEKGLDMENYQNTRNFKNGYFVVEKVL